MFELKTKIEMIWISISELLNFLILAMDFTVYTEYTVWISPIYNWPYHASQRFIFRYSELIQAGFFKISAYKKKESFL